MQHEFIWAIMGLILRIGAIGANGSDPCKAFLTANANYARRVHEAESAEDIRQILKDSSGIFIAANVINGTKWLNLGGSLTKFEPVIGKPPMTSSAMTLNDLLEVLEKDWIPRGTILNFHPDELVNELPQRSKMNSSLWISYPLLELQENCPFCQTFPPNIVWNKDFALDSMLRRFDQENLILPRERQRVRKIIEDFFQGSNEDLASDHRFLESQNKKVSTSSSSFSSLFLETATQLISVSNAHVIRGNSWDFLPDLQDKDTFYTKSDSEDLVSWLNSMSILKDKCVLVTLRAGPLLKSESLQAIQHLLNEIPNVIVNVFSEPYDRIARERLQEISGVLGTERVVFQYSGAGDAETSDKENHKADDDFNIRVPVLASTGVRSHKPVAKIISDLSVIFVPFILISIN